MAFDVLIVGAGPRQTIGDHFLKQLMPDATVGLH
jgi:hypothetical protein